jgi:hypothetical protein
MEMTPMSRRSDLLEKARECVDGDRNVQYGDPNADFQRTCAMQQIYLSGIKEKRGSVLLMPHDVAILNILQKISRIVWSPEKEDHWVDIAGYAACGADCIQPSENLLKASQYTCAACGIQIPSDVHIYHDGHGNYYHYATCWQRIKKI